MSIEFVIEWQIEGRCGRRDWEREGKTYAIFEKPIINTTQLEPTTPSLQFSEDVVFVFPLSPVQDSKFGRSLDSAGGGLFDVDVWIEEGC